ncbi:MAG: AMP-binding protein, partial [Planctomycetes bacterium]|nr:AMP-binding protein [Planctomycetota bacterium]
MIDPANASYVHSPGTCPLSGATLDQAFRAAVAEHADHEAVVSLPQRRRLTYRTLDAAVERMARGMLALDIGHGDRVAVWSTDNVEWIVLQLATARIGAVLVNVNPAYRPDELRHALAHARVGTVFTIPSFRSSHYVEMLRALCPGVSGSHSFAPLCAELPELRHLVAWDPERVADTARPAPGFLTWCEVEARGASVPAELVATRAAEVDPDDPVSIQFTSGTTGAPKAVVLTHHNLLNNAWFTGEAMAITAADRLCVPVPFYHCFGMVVSNLVCLIRGATLVIPAPHFEPGATLAAIAGERCTLVHGVPTMFLAELECERRSHFDLSSLRSGIMAGAPCPAELLRAVVRELGCDVLVGYGQTEASPVTHITRLGDSEARRLETVGLNLPHTETKIVDVASGHIVPRGQTGEVCVRGYHVMRGYFEQPEATANTVDAAGWLHTGDLGSLDRDGYLRITGRLKDMIIRG